MKYIDAEMYIKDLESEMYDNPQDDYERGYNKALKRAVVLTHASEEDPVKHGHWVEDDGGRLFNDHYCSLCNHYALRDGLGFECLTDWCGYCGAKMDEEVRYETD